MITVNAMLKSEPLAFYSLVSVAPYVDEVLVVDTGSEPEFLEPLYRAKELFPNISIHETKIPDAHGWTFKNKEVENVNEDSGKLLGDLRRWMHNNSKNPVVMILDGDEIYSDKAAEYVTGEFTKQLMERPNLECAYVPFVDLLNVNTIRQIHDMGRLFKKDKTYVHGSYPYEMHYSLEVQWCLLSHDTRRVMMMDPQLNLFAHHYEAIIKPHRKKAINKGPFTFGHPEVFVRYPEFWHLLEPYGLKPSIV